MTNKMLTMKTMYVLAAFLGLQFNTIFAAENFSESPSSVSGNATVTVLNQLSPVTPAEATFEDLSEPGFSNPVSDILEPSVPVEADFSDEAPAVAEVSVTILAPVTPKEADFEDETGNGRMTPQEDLAPVTPVIADFEDQA